MATNNIKLFDENKGNIMPDETYNANSQRLNGVQSGIASSQLQNKFQYQVSLVAYALGQIMIANGYDALDSSAVSAFVNNMSSSLLQKVVDKANQTQAQSGTDDTKYMTSAKVKLLIDYILSHNITISGNVNFTGTVSGQSPVADNNFTTKKYVDDSIGEMGYKLIWQSSFDVTASDIVIPKNTVFKQYEQYLVKLEIPANCTFKNTNINTVDLYFILGTGSTSSYNNIIFKARILYKTTYTVSESIVIKKIFNLKALSTGNDNNGTDFQIFSNPINVNSEWKLNESFKILYFVLSPNESISSRGIKKISLYGRNITI